MSAETALALAKPSAMNLALEQQLVLALEDLEQQTLFAAEVVVHEREPHARLVGHRAGAGRGMTALEEHVARCVDDPPPRRLAADRPAVRARDFRLA